MTEIHIEHDGEWVPLEGVTSIELNEEPATVPLTHELLHRWTIAVQAAANEWAKAVMPAMRALADAAAKTQRADQSQFALAPAPPRPTKRPAWQSPYGPPQKGHRR